MWWTNDKLGWADQTCGIAPWTAICKKPGIIAFFLYINSMTTFTENTLIKSIS